MAGAVTGIAVGAMIANSVELGGFSISNLISTYNINMQRRLERQHERQQQGFYAQRDDIRYQREIETFDREQREKIADRERYLVSAQVREVANLIGERDNEETLAYILTELEKMMAHEELETDEYEDNEAADFAYDSEYGFEDFDNPQDFEAKGS